MSVLDLQNLREEETTESGRKPSGSRASKGCNNSGGGGASGLSLLLC